MATYSVASGSWTYKLYANETGTDQTENYSIMTAKMAIYRANSQWSYITNGLYALKVTINGVTQTSPSVYVNKSTSQPEVDVVTLTFNVPHNEDGTGVASITYCQFQSLNGTSPATAVLGSMPKNITLTTIPRASDITAPSSAVMGTTQTVTVTQKSASFSHILYYSTDGTTFTEIGRGTASDDYSWTLPDTTSSLPDSTSTTYTLRCYTYTTSDYSGTPLETLATVTATVPASYVPTIAIGTITEGNNAVPSGFPFLVGVSTLIIPTTFTGSAGSTVVSRSVTANGETQTSTNSGSVTFNLTKALSALSTVVNASATDSRGRTGTASQTVTAIAYSAPTVEIDCTRCQSDGTIDALGEYVLVRAKWSWTSIGNPELNGADIAIKVDGTLKTTYTTQTNSQTTYTQIAILPNILVTNQYTITAEISDEVMSASVSQVVTKATLPLSLFDDGNGIGVTIGRMATREGFNVTLDTTLLSGQNINLFDGNNQQIKTMLTDDLFNGGGGLAKFVKGTPINLYDTDGETVLYSRNPENLVFYDGDSGEDVASNFIYANPSADVTLSTSYINIANLRATNIKGNGFEISGGQIKCNKNGKVRVIVVGYVYASGGRDFYQAIGKNGVNQNWGVIYNYNYSNHITNTMILNVVAGDIINVRAYATSSGATYRSASQVICEYIEDYYITQTISESNTYSISEIEVGKWVDGKSIYRAVVYNSSGWSLSSGWTTLFSVSGKNISTLVNAWLITQSSSTTKNLFTGPFQVNSSGNLQVYFAGSWSNLHYCVLEYTKTTD